MFARCLAFCALRPRWPFTLPANMTQFKWSFYTPCRTPVDLVLASTPPHPPILRASATPRSSGGNFEEVSSTKSCLPRTGDLLLTRPDGSFSLASPVSCCLYTLPCSLIQFTDFFFVIYHQAFSTFFPLRSFPPHPRGVIPKQTQKESAEEADDNVKHSHCGPGRDWWLDSVSLAPTALSPSVRQHPLPRLPVSLSAGKGQTSRRKIHRRIRGAPVSMSV